MTSSRSIALFLTHGDDVQRCWADEGGLIAERNHVSVTEYWAVSTMEQNHQILDVIHESQHDALVILPWTVTGPASFLCEAAKLGKSTLLIGRTTSEADPSAECSWPALRRKYPGMCGATVVPDARQTGHLQGQQFQALLPHGGNILYVLGDPMSFDSIDRLRGVKEVLGEGSRYRLHTAVGGFQEAVAETACLRWFRSALTTASASLDLIGSQGEAMIPGIRRACQKWAEDKKRPELLHLPMTAVDGTPRYRAEVDQGKLAATVETQSRVSSAFEILCTFWNSGKTPSEYIVEIPARSYPRIELLKAHKPRAGKS